MRTNRLRKSMVLPSVARKKDQSATDEQGEKITFSRKFELTIILDDQTNSTFCHSNGSHSTSCSGFSYDSGESQSLRCVSVPTHLTDSDNDDPSLNSDVLSESKWIKGDSHIQFEKKHSKSRITKAAWDSNVNAVTRTIREQESKLNEGKSLSLAEVSDEEMNGSECMLDSPRRLDTHDHHKGKNTTKRSATAKHISFIDKPANYASDTPLNRADENKTDGKANGEKVHFSAEVHFPTDTKYQLSKSENLFSEEVSGRKAHRNDEVKTPRKPVIAKNHPTITRNQSKSKLFVKTSTPESDVYQPEEEETKDDGVTKSNDIIQRSPEGNIINCKSIDDLNPSEIILSKVCKFDNPSCSEIEIYDKYMIILAGDNLRQVERCNMCVLKSVKMSDIRRMCKIHDHSLGILRLSRCICIVECETLEIKYNISTSKPYAVICHINSLVRTPENLPKQHYVFAVAYTNTNSVAKDQIDVIKASPGQIQNIKPKYNANVSSLNLKSTNCHGITSISSLTSETVIVGFSYDVECMKFDKKCSNLHTLWHISLGKAVMDIYCSKSLYSYVLKMRSGWHYFVQKMVKKLQKIYYRMM